MILHARTTLQLLYATSIGTFCINYKYVTLSRHLPYFFSLLLLCMKLFFACALFKTYCLRSHQSSRHVILIKPLDVFFMGRATNSRLLCKACGSNKVRFHEL